MKKCACCGAALERKAYEKPCQFRKRTNCGKSCALRMRGTPIQSPKTRYRKVRVNGRNKQLSRHLVESAIGRPLLRNEHVHHANEDKLDDRLENYEVLDAAAHARHHNQKHPATKKCAACGTTFTPHPTKRARAQTCGQRTCKSALLSLRNKQRLARKLCAEVVGHVIRQLMGAGEIWKSIERSAFQRRPRLGNPKQQLSRPTISLIRWLRQEHGVSYGVIADWFRVDRKVAYHAVVPRRSGACEAR